MRGLHRCSSSGGQTIRRFAIENPDVFAVASSAGRLNPDVPDSLLERGWGVPALILCGEQDEIAVGYSMGGPIAKLSWSRHRDRVRGLVLCATANHFMRPQVRGVASALFPGMIVTARLLPRFFRDRIVDGMTRGLPEGERRDRVRREIENSDPATVMQATRALIRFSSHNWAAGIDVPTAVVITTEDQLVPPSRQYRLAASIPGAKIFEVAGDHLACVRAAGRFVPTLLAACEYVAAQANSLVPDASTAVPAG